jgi:flagellar hook protein FlgE
VPYFGHWLWLNTLKRRCAQMQGKLLKCFNNCLAIVSPDSLTNITGDVFQVNSESGGLVIGHAGNGDLGTIQSSELESSTVDLATQLTNMVVAKNAYGANSKVFQTGAALLADLTNLIHS